MDLDAQWDIEVQQIRVREMEIKTSTAYIFPKEIVFLVQLYAVVPQAAIEKLRFIGCDVLMSSDKDSYTITRQLVTPSTYYLLIYCSKVSLQPDFWIRNASELLQMYEGISANASEPPAKHFINFLSLLRDISKKQ